MLKWGLCQTPQISPLPWASLQPPSAKYGGRHTVTMIPGDGIGPELMLHVKSVFRYKAFSSTGVGEGSTKNSVLRCAVNPKPTGWVGVGLPHGPGWALALAAVCTLEVQHAPISCTSGARSEWVAAGVCT